MLWILAGITSSYLIGSIPTAYVAGRCLKGIDIRTHGSGNIGATNALRVLGKGPGLLVLVLDILKGTLPVLFIGGFLVKKTAIPQEIVLISVGLACICGHIWTVFLNFNGGKGIATTLGVLIGLAFTISGLTMVLVLLLLTWLIIFLFSRLVSLASIITALVLPLYLAVFNQPKALLFSSFILTAFTVFRHKENLKRLLAGKEHKLTFTRTQPIGKK